ncbi:MAG: hypothetical protein IT438_05975 [Phycisphaerales bacterium]|nr:hypothetical protein [Phycisphaerales bacterium]
MPRRTRECVPQFDALEPRALFDAAHQPAMHNPDLTDEQVEVFMTASDEGEQPESFAASDADMYAAFLTKPAAKPVAQSTKKPASTFINDDDAWGRDRADDPTAATSPAPETDDQSPIITAAAHGDEKAIAIMLTWNDSDTDEVSGDITSSTAKPERDAVKIHANFVGEFLNRSRH